LYHILWNSAVNRYEQMQTSPLTKLLGIGSALVVAAATVLSASSEDDGHERDEDGTGGSDGGGGGMAALSPEEQRTVQAFRDVSDSVGEHTCL
jgi:Spy/CpxP family protein refolding chaperone